MAVLVHSGWTSLHSHQLWAKVPPPTPTLSSSCYCFPNDWHSGVRGNLEHFWFACPWWLRMFNTFRRVTVIFTCFLEECLSNSHAHLCVWTGDLGGSIFYFLSSSHKVEVKPCHVQSWQRLSHTGICVFTCCEETSLRSPPCQQWLLDLQSYWVLWGGREGAEGREPLPVLTKLCHCFPLSDSMCSDLMIKVSNLFWSLYRSRYKGPV